MHDQSFAWYLQDVKLYMRLVYQAITPQPHDPIPTMGADSLKIIQAGVPAVGHYHVWPKAPCLGASQHISDVVVFRLAVLRRIPDTVIHRYVFVFGRLPESVDDTNAFRY